MRTIPTRFCGFLILSVYLAGCNSRYKSKPVPAAAQISISATGAIAGSPDFTLTITGPMVSSTAPPTILVRQYGW